MAIGDEVTSLARGPCRPAHPAASRRHLVPAHDRPRRTGSPSFRETIDPVQASTLRVNPVTAWRLLHDFVDLSEGEWIAQNAANSGVGIATIHIPRKSWVCARSTLCAARNWSMSCKASEPTRCFSMMMTAAAAKALVWQDAPRLAANAVGGDSALRLMDVAAPHATLVTYGAMSRRS